MDRNLSVELRPEKLEDFIGCESIVGPIKEGIRQGRVDSTYQFYGPPGTGKTSMARALFKYICGPQEDYDLTEPDTGNLSADDVRELIAKSRINPWVGPYKGFILDEAHKISAPTQTILLKALEEPCASTIWFICSSEPGGLSDAIRRRGVNWILPVLNREQTIQLLDFAFERCTRPLGTAEKKRFQAENGNKLVLLVDALASREIASPGLIIRAFEKLITGVPASEAAQVSETSVVDTFAIAKGAAAGNWSACQQILAKAPRTAARDIRSAVAGYFRGILVKESAGSQRAERCVWAIEQMADLANQNQFEDGLIMAATVASVYKICVGQKAYITKKV